MNQLQSKINVRSEDFKTNQQAMQTLVTDLKQVAQRIALGGGLNLVSLLHRQQLVKVLQMVD